MSDVEALHQKISKMSLSELLKLGSMALEANMDDKKVDLILRYIEIALTKRNFNRVRDSR